MIKGLENLRYEERLKAIDIFFLKKRRPRADLITVFQYFEGGYKQDGGSLFTGSHMENTRGNGYKWYWERFHLDKRNTFFIVRTVVGTTFTGTWQSPHHWGFSRCN